MSLETPPSINSLVHEAYDEVGNRLHKHLKAVLEVENECHRLRVEANNDPIFNAIEFPKSQCLEFIISQAYKQLGKRLELILRDQHDALRNVVDENTIRADDVFKERMRETRFSLNQNGVVRHYLGWLARAWKHADIAINWLKISFEGAINDACRRSHDGWILVTNDGIYGGHYLQVIHQAEIDLDIYIKEAIATMTRGQRETYTQFFKECITATEDMISKR